MFLGISLSVVAALAQVAGGLVVLRNSNWPRAWERTLLALGAGFLLALVFIELIPQSFILTKQSEYALLVMLIGFSTLHLFEHIIAGHMHFGEETHHEHVAPSMIGAVGGLTVHAFFDGMSICAAAEAKSSLGILVFLAVLLHKIPEGLTVASVMKAGEHSHSAMRRANTILPLATLAGALLVLFFVTIDQTLIGFLFAFSAGSSVYVGACDLIPEINKSRGRSAPFIVFLGMLLFWIGSHVLNSVAGL
jgi:ZIP family zinc transporter/zinc and cadmium transporter